MGTVIYTFQICSHCRGRLRSGWPRFGAAAVKCGHCGTLLNTGIPSWSSFSGGGKYWVVVKEMFVPSFLPFKGFEKALSLIFGCMLIFMWIPIPFMLLYIKKNIRESKTYDQTKQPPVWKYGSQRL
jgi:hypothetical protein